MTVCEHCGEEMPKAPGCRVEQYNYPDGARDRIFYGSEDVCASVDAAVELPDHCHDCGAVVGHLHHPRCDVEQCPRCGGQAIACGCVPQIAVIA